MLVLRIFYHHSSAGNFIFFYQNEMLIFCFGPKFKHFFKDRQTLWWSECDLKLRNLMSFLFLLLICHFNYIWRFTKKQLNWLSMQQYVCVHIHTWMQILLNLRYLLVNKQICLTLQIIKGLICQHCKIHYCTIFFTLFFFLESFTEWRSHKI